MKRKGFTLIELLAVIIILGILLLIAIPGVTGYINNSRKNVYVDTAKELVKGTSKILNSGEIDTLDEDVTYYMDSRCISNESGKEAQSPFGKFNPAYVLVVNENDTYNYYFQSRDETSVGVKDITKMDDLQISKIVSDVKEEDIDTSVGIGNTTKTAIIDENCNIGEVRPASRRVSKDGESMITLTFDNQGGTGCDMQSQYYGEEWGKLCKPKKEGWKFVGWYTKQDKLGDKITKTTKAEKSMTVYAAWTDEYATFDTGKNVNAKIKQLAGQSGANFNTTNQNIIYIKVSEEEPIEANKQEINKLSISSSALPIYAWFDTDTLYIWSEDEEPFLNQDATYMFSSFDNLELIENIDQIDTSKTTVMSYMFWYAKKIGNLDVSNFDTSNVTQMDYMFNGLGYNTSDFNINGLDSFDTSKVTSMNSMFSYTGYGASTWNIGDINSWDTSNVTQMQYTFYYAGYRSSSVSLDLSDWETNSVDNMQGLFQYFGYNASEIEFGSFENWDVSNVKYLNNVFCYSGYMASSFILEGLGNWNISNAISIGGMFSHAGYYARNWSVGDLSNWDTSNVVSISGLFYRTACNSSSFEIGNIGNWNISKVYSLQYMFSKAGYVAGRWNIGDISSWDVSNVTDMRCMFEDAAHGKRSTWNIGNLNNWDVSNVTTMESMFGGAGSSSEDWNIGDIGSWNVSNVTTMFKMFQYTGQRDESWSIGNISNWDVSKVTDMSYMFEGAGRDSLTFDLGNLNNWNVSNVTTMREMFDGAGFDSTTWNIGDLVNWDTRNVTDMSSMFDNAGTKDLDWTIGTINIYADIIDHLFYGIRNARVIVNLHNNITTRMNYNQTFFYTACASGSSVVVNYTSNVANIDDIISSKVQSPYVRKGVQLD